MGKSPAYDRFDAFLSERNKNNLLRETAVPDPSIKIDCSTNSYLNLHKNRFVLDGARKIIGEKFAGNLASRLVSSESDLYTVLEKEIADWKKTESALLFNSGYTANVGILQSVCSHGTEVFSDRFNHASIIDGVLLSGAVLNRYRHCDTADLEQRVKKSSAREKVIVTDSVFSMDGDRAPLEDICGLAEKYNCLLIVDEAHAAGIFGRTLCGLTEECGVGSRVDIVMGTLSKAVGGLGAFFAGSSFLREYLVNSARSLIYSTGLPHSVLAYNLSAVRYIRKNPQMGKDVLEKADYLRERLKSAGYNTLSSDTQIIPCLSGNAKDVAGLSEFLKKEGIKVPFIRPPTVPKGTARLRFSVNAKHSTARLDIIADIAAAYTKLR